MAISTAGAILGGSAISGLSGIVGGLFGNKKSSAKQMEASSAKQAAIQYMYNMQLQQQAQNWEENMYKNRYQWQIEDLKKAGINPLYGLGSAPTLASGTNSVGMPTTPDYISENSSKKQQMLEAINMGLDWSAKKVQMNKIEEETKTEKINQGLKTLEKVQKDLDNKLKQKELNWYDKKTIADLKKTESETILNIKNATKSEAETENARERTNSERINRATEERKNQWYKNHPKIGGFITGSKEVIPSLFDLALTVGGGAYAAKQVKGKVMKKATTQAKKAGRAGTARNMVKK